MYIQNSELKLDKGIYAQRKNWNYEAKIALAKRRIEEWDVHWDGQVYLSFSGGLDSTVLLALIRKMPARLGNFVMETCHPDIGIIC